MNEKDLLNLRNCLKKNSCTGVRVDVDSLILDVQINKRNIK